MAIAALMLPLPIILDLIVFLLRKKWWPNGRAEVRGETLRERHPIL
jgi:hypothetical protein